MCLTTDDEIDDIVNGDNVSCSGIAILPLRGGLVPCGVLESCIANEQAMYLQEVCERCTVPVPGAARMLTQGVRIINSIRFDDLCNLVHIFNYIV